MPANDSMPHRGASAVRGGRRFAPYCPTEISALKPHASCPAFFSQSSTAAPVPSPQDPPLDCHTEVSSTATLVNSSFGPDKWDSPATPILTDKALKPWEKVAKFQQRQTLHQKKVDYVSVLIDFTCNSINDIWPESRVPDVFRYQCGANFGYTPETRGKAPEEFKTPKRDSDLINLRKFVQELLRRSRSTCSTLQNALCYVEAIRLRVGELQQAEEEGLGTRGESMDNEGRIIKDETCEVIEDESPQQVDANKSKLRKPPSQPSTPLPPLPSPLLCPRRAFMGALVLSAKFVQDKCYSNRAWAKLCGLPAREVSRCERALGDALGWRLWVGKDSLSPFARLESKVGRAPTMSNLGLLAVDDRKELFQPERTASPLGRAHTWPSNEVYETSSTVALSTQSTGTEIEMSFSPTPSLSYSSGSSSSSSSISGGLSPSTLLTPSPSFVPNDPCSLSSTKKQTPITRFRFPDSDTHSADGPLEKGLLDSITALRGACGDLFVSRREQTVFGIRVGEGIEVL